MDDIKSLIVTCIDYRIQTAVQNWLTSRGLQERSDFLAIPGGVKDIIAPSDMQTQEILLNYIKVSVELHKPKELILLDHQDCGGYAIDNSIEHGLDVNVDKEKHKKYLLEAKKLLQEVFKNTVVRTFYVELSGNISEIVN